MPTPQNGQTHSSAFGDESFECVGPFCGLGAKVLSVSFWTIMIL